MDGLSRECKPYVVNFNPIYKKLVQPKFDLFIYSTFSVYKDIKNDIFRAFC